MSANSLGKGVRASGLTLLVLSAFIGSQIVAGLLLVLVNFIFPEVANFNSAVLATVLAAGSYIIALTIIAIVEGMRTRTRKTPTMFGLDRSLRWSDLGISAAALVPYFLVSSLFIIAMTAIFNGVDPNQTQDIPFGNLTQRYEYIVSFIALVVLAPFVEELVFRGYFLGKMATIINRWLAVFITAFIFGSLHLFGEWTDVGVTLQWAAAFDTFILGLTLGALRVWTGSVWAGIVLHMIKNAIAYFFLFIYPNLAGTM